jgi:hypothetical protein
MKINRLELMAKIQRMVVEREVAAKERKEKALDKAAGTEREYLNQHTSDWGKFADRIRLRLRQGVAITIEDVPEGLRRGSRSWPEVRLFQPTTVNEAEFVPRTEPLTRLLAVLESCPDEFISTSALDRIGAPLKEMMRP